MPGDVKTNFTSSRIVENDASDEKEKIDIEKSIKKVEKDELSGKGPDSVAKIVAKVARQKHPPLRKAVGISYKLVVLLTRLLPTRVVNFIVRKLYCK